MVVTCGLFIAFTVYTVRLCRESVFPTVFLTVYRYSSSKQRLQKECLWRVLFSVKDDKEEGLRVKKVPTGIFYFFYVFPLPSAAQDDNIDKPYVFNFVAVTV